MDDKFRINDLLDFYDVLLTDKENRIADLYFHEDFSLQEIAEEEGITRAAVFDTVKRIREDLADYEKKLHLSQSWKKRSLIYEEMRKIGSKEIQALVKECIAVEKIKE